MTSDVHQIVNLWTCSLRQSKHLLLKQYKIQDLILACYSLSGPISLQAIIATAIGNKKAMFPHRVSDVLPGMRCCLSMISGRITQMSFITYFHALRAHDLDSVCYRKSPQESIFISLHQAHILINIP